MVWQAFNLNISTDVLFEGKSTSKKTTFLLLLAMPFLLASCSTLSEKGGQTDDAVVASTPQASDSSAEKQNTNGKAQSKELKMSSQVMFQIMAAELMAKRKQPQLAFNALLPVTQKLRDPELAKRLFQFSMATYHLQSIEQATYLWRDIAPESDVAWRASFVLSLRKGLVDQAMQEWDKFQQLSDKNLQSDIILAASKVSSAVPEQYGIAFFQQLTEKFPDEWTAFYGLGLVASIYKNAEVGVQALNEAKALLNDNKSDSNAIIHNLLSKLYLDVKPASKGIAALTPYLEDNPTDLLVQERVARLEVQALRYADAEKRYSYIVEQEPEAYTSLFSLALLQMESRDYDNALINLSKVANQQSYQTSAYYYLGILHQERGNFAKAKDYFNRVLNSKYSLDARLHLAEMLYSEGEKNKAYQLLDQIETNQKNEQIKVLRAKAILANSGGELEKAIQFYEQALVLEPRNTNVLKAQSLLLYQSDLFERYEQVLLKVIEIDGDDSEALNALGYFYVEKKINLDIAFNLLKRALQLQPDSFFILDSMGWYYYQVGDYQKALEYLLQAFDKSKDEEVFLHLISAHWANGQREEAQRLWEKYRNNFGSDGRAQSIMEDLEKGSAQ